MFPKFGPCYCRLCVGMYQSVLQHEGLWSHVHVPHRVVLLHPHHSRVHPQSEWLQNQSKWALRRQMNVAIECFTQYWFWLLIRAGGDCITSYRRLQEVYCWFGRMARSIWASGGENYVKGERNCYDSCFSFLNGQKSIDVVQCVLGIPPISAVHLSKRCAVSIAVLGWTKRYGHHHWWFSLLDVER